MSLLQHVVRVKKTDEAEDDDSDLTEDEIQALSQGLVSHTYDHVVPMLVYDTKVLIWLDIWPSESTLLHIICPGLLGGQ